MKWFLMVLMFSSVGMAKDKLIVSIKSLTNSELDRVLIFERLPDKINLTQKDKFRSVIERNKAHFELGANDVVCEVSFVENIASFGCEQTKNKKDRVIAEYGFSVWSTLDCNKNESDKLSFSNKTSNKNGWGLFELDVKCEQDKI